MKKLLRFFVIVSFALNFLTGNKAQAQCASSVVETITFGPYTCECCGSGVTNPSYFCFNDAPTAMTGPAYPVGGGNCSPSNSAGGVCGSGASSTSLSFSNPVPAGNIVTQIQLTYHAAPCGGTIQTVLNGVTIATDPIASSTLCACTNNVFGALAGSGTANTPCGLTGYNNGAGATENITFNFPGGVGTCMSAVDMTICYAPASQSVSATQPSPITGPTSVCAGGSYTYSTSSPNATGYTWSVPAGWAINSGQGSTSIHVTAGASGGSVCVDAYNLCLPASPQTCLAVSILPSSTTPNVPTANPNPICPGNPTTLSVSGGTLGGGNYTWYAGSCNSGVIGTGSSISVSPASATTYFVNITGGCNTTACTNVLVNVNGVQPTPSNPSGTASVCSGSTQVYTTTGAGGYNWTVPAGTTINSGQGTTSINVTIGSTAGNICVTSTGACGTSPAACTPITITSTPATPASITGTTPVCPGSDNYSVGAVAGATSYSWSVSGGGTVTGGQGTTAATINWTTPGSWIVNCSAVNSCGNSVAATFPITINSNPVISITPSATAICSGGAIATLTASGASTYTWTPNVTITSGLNAASITVMPTNTAAPTTYVVTGTNGNGCTGTANQAISVNPSPTVTVAGGGSNSQSVCSGGSVATISLTSSPAGTVNWTCTNAAAIGVAPSSGTGNVPGYTAPTVGTAQTGVITASSSAAGCTSTSSSELTYTITINPLPGATAPSYTPANCGVSNGVASIGGTGGSGTYQYAWNGGSFSTTNTYTNAAGTYPVSIKDMVSGCVFITSVSIPNAGAPLPPAVTASAASICPGGTITLSVNSPVAGMTYSWTESDGTGGTGTTYTITNIPSLPNPYMVGVTSTSLGCTGTSNNTSITINPLPPTPTFSLPTTANDTSCQGAHIALTVNSGTSTAVWYSGGTHIFTGSNYTPPTSLAAGTYTYSIIDSIPMVNGCINAPASANTVTLSLVINPSPSAPSTTSPTLTSECAGLPPITLSVTPTGTVTSVPVWFHGTTYLTTGNTYTPSNSTPGTTVYTVVDSSTILPNTCTSAAAGHVLTFTVTVNPSPPAPIFTAPTTTNNSYCQGSPTALTVNTGTIIPTPTAVWYSNNIEVFVGTSYTPPTSLAAGTYTFSIIDSLNIPFGCTNALQSANTVTLSLTVKPAPPIPILTNTATTITECQNQVPRGSFTINPVAGVIPVWYNTATTSTVATGNVFTPSDASSGSFLYYVIDSSTTTHCTSAPIAGGIVNVGVTVNPTPTVPILTNTTNVINECQGASATTLSVTPSVGSTPVWYSSATGGVVAMGSTYTPPNTVVSPPPVVYSIIDSATTIPATGCTSIFSGSALTVTVTINPSPTINVTNLTSLDSANCGKAGTLTVSPSAITGLGTPPLHYQWLANGHSILNDTTLILTTDTIGVAGTTYSLQISDANGCFAIAAPGTGTTFTVPSVPSPTVAFSPSSPITTTVSLAITFTNQTVGANNYVWTFGDGGSSTALNPQYTYTAAGTYTATLMASNGSCPSSLSAIVIADEPTMIVIPNIFSPNGDNINDLFFIINTGMSSLNCTIFNRWGQLLYTITAPSQSWDGKTPNGDNAPDGTYMYILQAQGLNGKTYKQNGTVTLVR